MDGLCCEWCEYRFVVGDSVRVVFPPTMDRVMEEAAFFCSGRCSSLGTIGWYDKTERCGVYRNGVIVLL